VKIDAVYVQRKEGEFVNETAFAFWHGCQMLGVETRFYEAEQIDQLPLTRETLVHGWVGMVRRAFQRLGVQEPQLDGMPPEEIRSFFGRRLWTMTMGEVRARMDRDEHIFIKPLYRQKAFTGHVTSGRVGDLIRTASFDDDFEVLASEVVNFEVEYRLLVHNQLIAGCRHYNGDFTKSIDFEVALGIVRAYKSAPVAYSLDMGVTDKGLTLPVEINDMFALGNYGMPAVPYAMMVIDRWEEIVGL
jgi:hypothetical protein